MRHNIFILIPFILIVGGCRFGWTRTNLYNTGFREDKSLYIVNDTSFFLVTDWDSIEVFKSKNEGLKWEKLLSFNGKWFCESNLLSEGHLYIAMKNREDTCHAISKYNLYDNGIKTLILPDSVYCQYGATMWMGDDGDIRVILKSNKRNRLGVYHINKDFNSIIFERGLPKSETILTKVVINDSVIVYKNKHTKEIVISYPHKEEVISRLCDKYPCVFSEGKLYLTSLKDSTDCNIYSYDLTRNIIDTIPSFYLRKSVIFAKKDTLVTSMYIHTDSKVFGVITNKGETLKRSNSIILHNYCYAVYKKRLYIYSDGEIRHYNL